MHGITFHVVMNEMFMCSVLAAVRTQAHTLPNMDIPDHIPGCTMFHIPTQARQKGAISRNCATVLIQGSRKKVLLLILPSSTQADRVVVSNG